MKKTIIYLMTTVLLLTSCAEKRMEKDARKLLELEIAEQLALKKSTEEWSKAYDELIDFRNEMLIRYSNDLIKFQATYVKISNHAYDKVNEKQTPSNIQNKSETKEVTNDNVKKSERNSATGLSKTFDSAMGKITIKEYVRGEMVLYIVETISSRVVVGESLYEDGGFMKGLFFFNDDTEGRDCVVTCSPYDFGFLLKNSITEPVYITIFDEDLENMELTISLYVK